MKINLIRTGFLSLLIFSSTSAMMADDDRMVPIYFQKVSIDDVFWNHWLDLTNTVTVPFALDNGKEAAERFRVCADYVSGRSDQLPRQARFVSSDLYKSMECAAYSLEYDRSPELESRMDSIIAYIAATQQDDGYLYIDHICHNPRVNDEGLLPYSELWKSHELYNVGHMYEAAVAYYMATGKDELLHVAVKNAEHVNRAFFVGDPAYNGGKPVMEAPGHEEIEIALCEMYRLTGKNLYLDMARKLIELRGRSFHRSTYNQSHQPVSEQRTAVGHAVRAGYLYAAMAEVDILTGRSDYTEALHSIWQDIVSGKMHITGGLGAVHGIEGFGDRFDLPNKSAYDETCAAVANVFFNYRMFQAEADAKYLDIMELSLFNGALAGIGLDGKSFFYENPLECDGVKIFNKGTNARSPWYGCACCPPNILRLILQVPGYMYSHTSDRIYANLYGGSHVSVGLKTGKVDITQESCYPFQGTSEFTVSPRKDGMEFAFCLRIPTWAREKQFIPGGIYTFSDGKISGFSVRVNGSKVSYTMEKGFAVIQREWKEGDHVSLDLPMYGRYVDCDRRVLVNLDRRAVVRGPLVYCAEGADNENVSVVQRFYLSAPQKSITEQTFTDGVMKDIVSLHVKTGTAMDERNVKSEMTLIPYYAWNNRKLGNTMVVWIPVDFETALNSLPGYGYSDHIRNIEVSTCSSRSIVGGICDGAVASGSMDMHSPFWTSVGMDGSEQTVTVEFDREHQLVSLGVYWTDRSKGEETYGKHINKVPKKWAVDCRVKGEWIPMPLYIMDFYETRTDQFNVVHPEGKTFCDAVKIRMIPHEGYTVGISEVNFDFNDK